MFHTKRTNLRKASLLSCITTKQLSKRIHPKNRQKAQQEKKQPRDRPEEEPKQTKSINLPYIREVSKQLKRALNKCNIKATFYPDNPQKSIIKTKGPKEDRNNAVYQFNCKDCEAVYVGETMRTMNIRAESHITAIKSASKRSHTAEQC